MTVIDDHLNEIPSSQREALSRIRDIVRREVPDAEEVIGYGTPTFKFKGKNLIHFAAFKDHLSIFPTPGAITANQERLAKYQTGKGTLRFTETDPVPERIIVDLVTSRRDTILRDDK